MTRHSVCFAGREPLESPLTREGGRELDPVAVWTALGVICGAIVGLAVLIVSWMVSDNARLRRRITYLESEKVTFMQALIDADHDRREAQQSAKNSQAARRIRLRKETDSGSGEAE